MPGRDSFQGTERMNNLSISPVPSPNDWRPEWNDLPALLMGDPEVLRAYGFERPVTPADGFSVPVAYVAAQESALRRRIADLDRAVRARPGRKRSGRTRAKFERMKQLRVEGVKWVVIAKKLGYKDSRSAQNGYRALRKRYGP
jgi:hypothetical protein